MVRSLDRCESIVLEESPEVGLLLHDHDADLAPAAVDDDADDPDDYDQGAAEARR